MMWRAAVEQSSGPERSDAVPIELMASDIHSTYQVPYIGSEFSKTMLMLMRADGRRWMTASHCPLLR